MIRKTSLLIALLSLFSGCKALDTSWAKDWNWFAKNDKTEIASSNYPTPVRVAAIWSPAMYSQTGKPPTRGFGGRLYFYDGANKPVAVEGQLVVYAYDESKSIPNSKTPKAKFAFTPEQFTQHFSPTELGASYSVWIPWDAAGGPQAEISLVPVFTATAGQLVIGQPSKNLLPGPTTPETRTEIEHFTIPPAGVRNPGPPQPAFGVQQASFQQPEAGTALNTGRPSVESLSIALPGTLADRMAKAPPQAPLGEQLEARRAAMAQRFVRPSLDAQAVESVKGLASRTAGEVPPPWFPPNLPPIRFEPLKPPARGAPVPPQAGGQTPTPPFPAAPPSGLPWLPQSGPSPSVPGAWPAASQTGP